MDKYHGTPVSGTRRDVTDFVRQRKIMVSMLRPDDLEVALESSTGVLIDSGEYTKNRTGGEINLKDFTNFLAPIRNHPRFVAAIMLDITLGVLIPDACL